MQALFSRAFFSLVAYAVFFAPLGLMFLLLTEILQQPRFSVDPFFTFLILLLPTYAWGWVPTLTAFILGAASSIGLYALHRRKRTKKRVSLNTLLLFGAILGSATGSVAMYLWQPSVQISLLAGAFPGACCGFLSALVAFDNFEMPSFVERGLA
jgi:ABC-type Fe3+-siderophore transport system permease subunit